MLKAPFSRAIVRPLPSNPTCLSEPASDASELAAPFHYILPAATRLGSTLARTRDDLEAYYATELQTTRLNEVKPYLWLAGLPSCARPLHRQQLLGREIIITEDVDEHLVWYEKRIYIKPLPIFLLDLDCWTERICTIKQLHEAACGFLLSYAWLVRYESDLRIAHEKGLLPKSINWAVWTDLVDDLLEHFDLQTLSEVSPRYHYGELRLSRLNKIYRVTRLGRRDFLQGYMATSTWYQEFFSRNFAWLLAVFAVVSVALSAMQVVVAIGSGGQAFETASYRFSVASLLLVAVAIVVVLLFWVVLFVYHVGSARMNDHKVMNERKVIKRVTA